MQIKHLSRCSLVGPRKVAKVRVSEDTSVTRDKLHTPPCHQGDSSV